MSRVKLILKGMRMGHGPEDGEPPHFQEGLMAPNGIAHHGNVVESRTLDYRPVGRFVMLRMGGS